MDFLFDITFKDVMKDGKKYYQIDKMTAALKPKKVVFNFENLFNGNKELGENDNNFIFNFYDNNIFLCWPRN